MGVSLEDHPEVTGTAGVGVGGEKFRIGSPAASKVKPYSMTGMGLFTC